MREIDAHFDAYEHLRGFPREDEALHLLRRAASLVKPIMRKRGWKIGTLSEFYPDDPHLQGLNINKTQRIFLRLRSAYRKDTFLVLEVIVDTLLHELSHIIFGPHDEHFQKLWDELRDEHQTLLLKGYTGENFLSEGHVLGGKRMPVDEMRRQARARAESRWARGKGSGQRLGGGQTSRVNNIRQVIAGAAIERNRMTEGCGAGSAEAQKQATDQAQRNGFTTKAEEDDANDIAIANALIELMEREEEERLGHLFAPSSDGGLSWSREGGLSFGESTTPPAVSDRATPPTFPPPTNKQDTRHISRLAVQDDNRRLSRPSSSRNSSFQPDQFTSSTYGSPTTMTTSPIESWACEICTLVNPVNYLCCDACGTERSTEIAETIRKQAAVPSATDFEALVRQKEIGKPMGWSCATCGTFMERQWWTCSVCGTMKQES